MTLEESAQVQKDQRMAEFRRDARMKALHIARYMKPNNPPFGNFGQGQITQPHYDLLGEAEKIYQWLIKTED